MQQLIKIICFLMKNEYTFRWTSDRIKQLLGLNKQVNGMCDSYVFVGFEKISTEGIHLNLFIFFNLRRFA